MSPRESRTVLLAVFILRQACKSAASEGPQTPPVRLALRVLLPYVNKDTLITFWKVAAKPNPAQRVGLLKQVLDLIEADVARARE